MKTLRLSLVFLILQMFCVCLHRTSAENLNAIRVIVNGEIITEFDIRKRVAEALRMAVEKYSESELPRREREIIADGIDELIDRKLLVQEAKKVLREKPEKAVEIEKNLDSFVKGAVEEVGSLYKFYELAHKQGINPLKKRAELKEDLMIEEIMRDNVYRKIVVTPKEMKKYYTEHIAEFSKKGSMSFRQILIKYSGFNTKEEAKSAAEDLLKRLKNGEDFDALAKTYSHGPHSGKGGLWEHEEVNDFRKDLVDTISNLKKDEISPIINSSLGYHIFKIEEIIPLQTLSFQQVQSEIRNTLFRDEFLKKKKEYLNELRKKTVIKRY